MDTPAYTSPQSSDTPEDPDAQFAARLDALRQERDKILAEANEDVSTRFPHLNDAFACRLQMAADLRDLHMANIRANFSFESQQAWNEFERGKRCLQSAVLDVAADRRRRLEHIRTSSLKRRKKTRPNDRLKTTRPPAARPPHAFLSSLERQGLVRLVLTPDEVNADLAGILRSVDSARLNSTQHFFLDGSADKSGDKIHSFRGTLHYHDSIFEKGDRVSVLANQRPKPVFKFTGVLQSINSKELNVRTEDGSTHRVFVANLKNGRNLLRDVELFKTS